jgi:PEGA domain
MKSLTKVAVIACAALFMLGVRAHSQGGEVFGEVQFEGGTAADRDSGVWIDANYLGLVKELHGSKKVLLPAGPHDISVRQPGYEDSLITIMVQAAQLQTVQVNMHPSPPAQPVDVTSSLNLNVRPGRAAVLIDDQYLGRGSDFARFTRPMPLVPGTHRIKIELSGYRTFETEVSLVAGQTSKIKARLVKDAEDATR